MRPISCLSTCHGRRTFFERLRRHRPEITDAHSGSLPALRHALLWRVGMRCARPWNSSSRRGLLPHRSPPFQTPPLSAAVEGSKDGAPF